MYKFYCWWSYILLMTSQIWRLIFSTPLCRVTGMSSMDWGQKVDRRTEWKGKFFCCLCKCHQQLSAIHSELLQMVLSTSACTFALLAGKLWLLFLRSAAPSPIKGLKGRQEFGLWNLSHLSVTSMFSLCELGFDWKKSCTEFTACATLCTCLVHIFQQFNIRKATHKPFKLRIN